MEKGAQIVTDLYEIQDVVQRYTDIISIIADVDVEVVDEHLVRIAGTGLFADVVNKDMSKNRHPRIHPRKISSTVLSWIISILGTTKAFG